MKNLMLCSALLLCACAASSQTLRNRAEPVSGEWKGVLVKGDTRTLADVQFAGSETRATFWGSETTPIAPEGVGVRPAPATAVAHGRQIHFEVPRAGTFDGVVDGETMEGTFTDATGSGTFRLEKQPAWDDPRDTP
ncbi:MAG TPA: hypothetical protein VFL36_06815 [Myxococcales bacterium]|nr:hypothetical protein [Myxococcales bacterium]